MSITERLYGDVPVRDATAAAAAIQANEVLGVSGFGSVGYPKAVPRVLANADRDLSLTVISGGSVGEDIDVDMIKSGAIERRYPYQSRSVARKAVNDGQVAFHDRHISQVGDEVTFGELPSPDTAVVEAVAASDDWFIPTTSVGHTHSYVEAADRVIIEVNQSQPLGLQALHDVYPRAPPPHREPIPLSQPDDRIGSPKVRFDSDKLVSVVKSDIPDSPYEFRDPNDSDLAITEHLGDFLSDEVKRNELFAETVSLQFGVGSLGNALMSEIESIDFGDREIVYFGEVIQDGLLDLLDEGKLSAASASSLALSADGFKRLFDDIGRYAEDIVLRNADVSNNAALVDRFGVISVNTALEVDIYGNVNSTHIDGRTMVNGIGGSGDFTRNSHLSVIVLSSAASDGENSRIVPFVPHTDHTEHDVSIIVTEQGIADLRGLSPRERAERIIEQCTHPAFREQLREYYRTGRSKGGHIPHTLDRAFDWE